MAAAYEVNVFHGASPTEEAWPAGGRFHRADTSPTTDGATTYIPIPTSGTNYSWRKHFKLKVTTTPVGAVSNLRFFSDGSSWGTGVTAYAKKDASYTQGSSSDNSAQLASSADVTTYTSASPLSVNSGEVIANPDTGYGTQDYVVMQVGGTSSAAAGTTSARTLTYRVDET
jgi:hypothetical protein